MTSKARKPPDRETQVLSIIRGLIPGRLSVCSHSADVTSRIRISLAVNTNRITCPTTVVRSREDDTGTVSEEEHEDGKR